MIYYSTTVTGIGAEVPDLLDGGVLILYADGAPPALAEISVQHRVDGAVPALAPPVGASIFVGDLSTRVSAVGSTAWSKVRELGHVVLNFNGARLAERPGEICGEPCDLMAVRRQMRSGNTIRITDCSLPERRGAPERSASGRPSSRCSTHRARHWLAICGVTRWRAATTSLPRQSATPARRMICCAAAWVTVAASVP